MKMEDLICYKPQKPFSQKHLLTLLDYTPDENIDRCKPWFEAEKAV